MRLVAISDVHGNLPALEKIFAFIDKINVYRIVIIIMVGDIYDKYEKNKN